MHENFITLDREKRDRIINSAMHEFSAKGFKDASTNEIVKNAGISKGALFHYFPSKRILFEFLFRYSIDIFIEAVSPRIKKLPSDVFERWLAYAALKIEIAAQYPDITVFMQRAYKDEVLESRNILKQEFERFTVMVQGKIYDGIDISKFRPDIDVTRSLQIIWWVLEGFALSIQNRQVNLSKMKTGEFIQSLTSEMSCYLDILKKSFYV